MKTYIQFDAPKRDSRDDEKSFGTQLLEKVLMILTKVTPTANPDFDCKIDEVEYWLVECDDDGIPEREIGLDKEKRVIMKMPFKDNCGYWTDNNLLLNDFKEHFIVSEINKQTFEQMWVLLDSN